MCVCLEDVASYEDLDKMIGKDVLTNKLICTICRQFTHRCKENVRNHVEAKHFKGFFVHNCKMCGEPCPTKIALQTHRRIFHREEKYQRY